MSQIYLAVSSDYRFIKIGRAVDVPKRVHDLSAQADLWSAIYSADKISVILLMSMPGDKILEKYLHERWKKFHYVQEWYLFHNKLREWAMDLAEHPGKCDDLLAESRPKPKSRRTRKWSESERTDHKTRLARKRDERLQAPVVDPVCSVCWTSGEHRTWCSVRR